MVGCCQGVWKMKASFLSKMPKVLFQVQAIYLILMKCLYWLLLIQVIFSYNTIKLITCQINYLFKVNNRNTRTRCERCSKLTIKTLERRQWLVFLLLTLNIFHTLWLCAANFEQVNAGWIVSLISVASCF